MNDNVIRKSSYLEKWDIQKIMERAEEENNKMILENLENVEEEFVANIFGNDKLNQALDFINNKVYSDRYERNEVKAEYIKNNYDKTIKDFETEFKKIVSVDELLESDVGLERIKESPDYDFFIHNGDVETFNVDYLNDDDDTFITVIVTDDLGSYDKDIFTIDEYEKLENEDVDFEVGSKCLRIPCRSIEDIILGEEDMDTLIHYCINQIITYDYENYS